ncbi:hypothetical protein JCM10207_008554 [Rhodosporidiobolus poonsookiae]
MHALSTLLPLFLSLASLASPACDCSCTSSAVDASTVSSAVSTSTSSAQAVATGVNLAAGSSSDGLVGYATLNGGTTGGEGGSETTVSDLDSLRNAVEGDDAAIIYIDGIIEGDGETVKVGSNKSILPKNGGGSDGLTGGGFMIKEGKNVIIRGLSISKSPAPTDLIAVQESTNVWIDQNTLSNDLDHDKDYYDGQVDLTHAADYISVTRNIFKDSYKTSLVGHSDSNEDEDTGHLRVTYFGNLFENCNSRLPSLRFGTGHVANNYYKDILSSGINSRLGAEILVESNYFESVKKPIETSLEDGYVVVNDDNVYVDSDEPDLSNVGTISANDLGYSYSLDAGADVPAIVAASAGAENYSA